MVLHELRGILLVRLGRAREFHRRKLGFVAPDQQSLSKCHNLQAKAMLAATGKTPAPRQGNDSVSGHCKRHSVLNKHAIDRTGAKPAPR